MPGEISIVPGPLLRVKLKSGGASVGGLVVVFELTELERVEDVVVALEDVVVLNDVEVLDVDVDVAVVLDDEALCVDLG